MEEYAASFPKKGSLQTEQSLRLPDYRDYRFGRLEWAGYAAGGIGLACLLSYLFFRSAPAVIVLSPIVPLFMRVQRKARCEKRKNMLKLQFRDALQSVSAALQAGYSVENAVKEAWKDMENMYGSGGMITVELRIIIAGIRNNRTLEALFLQLAERSGLEDIQDFAEILAIAKRSGGDLPTVIRLCSATIGEKIGTGKEIRTLLSSKRLEGRIMDVIPCMMILYIDVSSPGFLDPLYCTWMGRLIMTACLAVYIGAVLLSEKIMSIEV